MPTCPDCKGEGQGFAIMCGPGGGRTGYVPCTTCKGYGHVSDEHAARIEQGERIRRERIGRNVSLREDAKRLNVSAAELSHVEQGREPETDEGRRALETRLRELEASAPAPLN